MVCSSEDPRSGPCPISLASAKKDIDYLSPEQVRALADETLAMPLATWVYAIPNQPQGEHVGFIIDDQPDSPAVRGERVDLYGYTTMAVATVQAQQGQIEAQQARIEAQERELEALRQEVAAIRASLGAR
jgi:hypothetical protein